MKRLILLLSVLGMLSCTRNENLERTFQRAGENRAELEKVLLHYEGDERKHRAALFLLERMADCYSYADPRIDSMKQLKYLSSLPGRETWTDSVKKVWGHVSTRYSTKVYDARGCVKIENLCQCVILSIAKNLETSTLCIQILHFVQDDTTF